MIENKFDIYEPLDGHEERFLQKLSERNITKKTKRRSLIRKIVYTNIAVAVLIFVAFTWNYNAGDRLEIASQVAYESEQYYLPMIEENIEIIKNSNNELLAKDALNQLNKMKTDYERLRNEIIAQGENEFLITAIHTNFDTQLQFSNRVITMINPLQGAENET
ncbi:hypothetical protein [Capnocytophaga canis]|uniref:hypothetical protein n=1 Tax=Capnocytophaga canis TaxID=1848903 RepID=UPI001562E2F5|nr:hypothetical protein [Capnocytophaga canis]